MDADKMPVRYCSRNEGLTRLTESGCCQECVVGLGFTGGMCPTQAEPPQPEAEISRVLGTLLVTLTFIFYF
jgi:hypothetical protein